jgi:uncharacterized protein YndB with AHSA1/START domain
MTYEFTIERLFDAPRELVFDTLFDPAAQEEIFAEGAPEGYRLLEFEVDLRVGGTSTTVLGPEGREPDRLTNVFTEVDRPRRIAYRHSMYVGEWGRSIDSLVTMTFEERDGKTLLMLAQSGFASEEERDSFRSGAPGYLAAVEKVLAPRTASEISGAAPVVGEGR